MLGRVRPASQLIVGDEILVAVEPFAERLVSRDRAHGTAKVSFAALGLDVSSQIEVLLVAYRGVARTVMADLWRILNSRLQTFSRRLTGSRSSPTIEA